MSAGRIKDIDFWWDRALNFDGETGPYVQYTYARCCSVLGKAHVGVQPDYAGLSDPEAQDVVRLLERFPELVHEAAQRYEPSLITRYNGRPGAGVQQVLLRAPHTRLRAGRVGGAAGADRGRARRHRRGLTLIASSLLRNVMYNAIYGNGGSRRSAPRFSLLPTLRCESPSTILKTCAWVMQQCATVMLYDGPALAGLGHSHRMRVELPVRGTHPIEWNGEPAFRLPASVCCQRCGVQALHYTQNRRMGFAAMCHGHGV